MKARTVTGWEARVVWLTFTLSILLHLPYKRLIQEWVQSRREALR